MRPCSLRRIFGGARCFFVRRCGQTRRSCCINQLVSPRALRFAKRLRGFSHDVTGDRPTIKRTHKKRNTPIRYAPLKKTLSRRISRPSSAQNGAERNGRAEPARLINIGQSERSVLGHAQSKPASYQGAPYAIRPRVQLSGGRSLKINSHHAQPLSFQICFYYNRLRAGCQWQNRKKASSAASRASERERSTALCPGRSAGKAEIAARELFGRAPFIARRKTKPSACLCIP